MVIAISTVGIVYEKERAIPASRMGIENTFSDDVGNILFGQKIANNPVSLMSPDNTSDGWLKKKWKIIDGRRCLIKGGSAATQQEPYNEVLASRIMDRLDIPHVKYSLLVEDDYPYSVCEDFITPEICKAESLKYTCANRLKIHTKTR